MPDVGVQATMALLRRPAPGEGFDEVATVRWDGAGGFKVAPVDMEDVGGR